MSGIDFDSTAAGFVPAGALVKMGRYQIVGKLATGGMAEVYLARHGEISGFQTLVVVKRILPHLVSDPQFLEMFLDEARIAARLDHPNVVRIVEVGRDAHEFFLVMDLVQGESVAEVGRRATKDGKPMGPTLAAYVAAQAAAGLHHAHTLTDTNGRPLHIVHRDVSPQNILISFDGVVKVIDFGVARARGRVSHTHTGGLKGKFSYMSPEQADGTLVDARSDIFALGVVLWELATGRRLFKRETDLATMRAIVDEPYPRPSKFATIAPGLEDVVMRALAKNRDDRYASAGDMQAALEGYLFNEGVVGAATLAPYMRSLLPDRLQRWKDAVRMALEKGESTGEIATRALLGTPSAVGSRSQQELSANVLARAQKNAGGRRDEHTGIETVYSKPAPLPAEDLIPVATSRRKLWLGLGAAAVLGVVGLAITLSGDPAPPIQPTASATSKRAPRVPAPAPTAAEPTPPQDVAKPALAQARLFVAGPRGARIYIDDAEVGIAPFSLPWTVGTVKVRADLAGHEPSETTVELRGDQPINRVDLKPGPVIAAHPSKAKPVKPRKAAVKKAAPRTRNTTKPADTKKPNPF